MFRSDYLIRIPNKEQHGHPSRHPRLSTQRIGNQNLWTTDGKRYHPTRKRTNRNRGSNSNEPGRRKSRPCRHHHQRRKIPNPNQWNAICYTSTPKNLPGKHSRKCSERSSITRRSVTQSTHSGVRNLRRSQTSLEGHNPRSG